MLYIIIMNISEIFQTTTEGRGSAVVQRDEDQQRNLELIVNKKVALAMKKVVHIIVNKVDEMFDAKV